MSVIRRRLVVGAVTAFVAIVLYVFITPSYRLAEPSVAGKRAEDFPVTIRGKQAHLSDFRGKLVVLNFWASWCQSCREEMPDLDRLQERIRSRGGVVLAVSVDENCSSYEDFLKIYPVRFQTACDPNKNEQVALDYGSVMIPETFVIDRQGYIARKIEGPQEWVSPEMTKYFDTALASY